MKTTPVTKNASTPHHYFTIGTAGHIDHGKTTLTKALTGKDTDRLKEEQERNISIEVGYASYILSDGNQVGVVDVPGHERFIRQMVAGVAGIDLVLLVIAADEGVMPQTKEHIDILHLLGVKRGLIVLTKIDQADEELIELVSDDLRSETQNTFLAEAPILKVNSINAQGIDKLKEAIEGMLAHIPARPIQGITRLPIDRVFSKKGFGSIITGTLYQGKMNVGDELGILPHGKRAKVRHLQVHGETQETAYAGQRVAVNLSGIDKENLERGHVLVTVNALKPTQRLDIEFCMLADLSFNIKQRSDIRLHIETSEVLGRIIFFDRNECRPGESCYAQLELSEPIITLFEDRFVVRRPTPMTTVGGGVVIDPYAEKHRFGPTTIEHIMAKKEKDMATRAAHIIETEGIRTVQQLIHQLGISHKEWEQEISTEHSQLKLIPAEPSTLTLVITPSLWEKIWHNTDHELQTYHHQYPLREGIDRQHLKNKYFPALNVTQWNTVLAQAEEEQRIKAHKETVSQADFKATLTDELIDLWQHVQQKMKQSGIETPDWETVLQDVAPRKTLSTEASIDFRQWLLRHGDLTPLGDERYMSKEGFEAAVKQLKSKTGAQFAIQDARQAFDTSRKFLIPFLETLDRFGLTIRQGNERKWK